MRSFFSILLLASAVAVVPACSGDDGDDDGAPAPDAGVDTVDSGTDTPDASPSACVLAPTTVSCTVGDDSPCTAVCAGAYCYSFNQLPTPVCTQSCSTGTDCPSGWSCNNMGRCRPPG